MTTTLLAVLLAFLGLAVYVTLHLAISRYFVPEKKWGTMRNLFLVLIVLLWFGTGELYEYFQGAGFASSIEGIDFAAIFLIIMMIHVGYLTFYAFIDRSITVRTFVEIEKRGNKAIPYSELEKIYDPKAAYARRLEILIQSGFIVRDEGKKTYTLKPKGVRVSTVIRMFKRLYRMGPGG